MIILGFGHSQITFDIISINLDFSPTYDKAKLNRVLFSKLSTSSGWAVIIIFFQKIEYLIHVFNMFFSRWTIDENIIEDDDKVTDVWT